MFFLKKMLGRVSVPCIGDNSNGFFLFYSFLFYSKSLHVGCATDTV